jgi:hypothetical protein
MFGAMFAAGWTGTVISGDEDQVRLQLRDGSCEDVEEVLVGDIDTTEYVKHRYTKEDRVQDTIPGDPNNDPKENRPW